VNWFAVETCALLLVAYVAGCVAGCWLRRILRGRLAG